MHAPSALVLYLLLTLLNAIMVIHLLHNHNQLSAVLLRCEHLFQAVDCTQLYIRMYVCLLHAVVYTYVCVFTARSCIYVCMCVYCTQLYIRMYVCLLHAVVYTYVCVYF